MACAVGTEEFARVGRRASESRTLLRLSYFIGCALVTILLVLVKARYSRRATSPGSDRAASPSFGTRGRPNATKLLPHANMCSSARERRDARNEKELIFVFFHGSPFKVHGSTRSRPPGPAQHTVQCAAGSNRSSDVSSSTLCGLCVTGVRVHCPLLPHTAVRPRGRCQHTALSVACSGIMEVSSSF